MDLKVVLKAAQTLSEEIEVTVLIKNLMTLVIENAGAQEGSLFLEKNGTVYQVATISARDNKFVAFKGYGQHIKDAKSLPLSVINFVVRSRENVVVGKAIDSEMFVQDPYLLHKKVKSLLCVPITHHTLDLLEVYMKLFSDFAPLNSNVNCILVPG